MSDVRGTLEAIESAVSSLGAAGLRRAAAEAHSLAADGYEALGHAYLDPLPIVVRPEQWELLHRGLVQRARLFEALHADLYGARSLLRTSRALPVEALLRDPRFLRAAVHPGPTVPQPLALTTRVVRTADDGWAVLEDAADVPIGVASALALRRVLSRTAPELYRTTPVRRLLPFTDRLRATAHAPYSVPSGRPEGLVGSSPERARTAVLLEAEHPGDPADARAMAEHRMLARLLGAPVVTTSDLRLDADGVRATALGRSADGSSRSQELIDHLIRLVPGAHTDPLDLGPSPISGVPGLVEAARADLVRITNPLGTGVLESAALRPLLPDLCRALLHEDLLLPPAQPGEALHEWPALVAGPFSASAGAAIDRRAAVLQLVTIGGGRGNVVMPGGVGLVLEEPVVPSAGEDGVWADRRAGRTLKDVWVLGADSESHTSGIPVLPQRHHASTGDARTDASLDDAGASSPRSTPPPGENDDARASSSDLDDRNGPEPVSVRRRVPLALRSAALPPSMGADLLWLGRDLERVDSGARMVRALSNLAIDLEADADAPAAAVAGHLLRALPGDAEPLPGHTTPQRLHAAIRRAVTREPEPGLLPRAVFGLDRAASSLRDVLSSMLWPALSVMEEQLDVLDRASRTVEQPRHGVHLEAPLNQLVQAALSAQAAIGETLPRRYGWFLYDAGRRVERMRAVISLIAAAFTEEEQLPRAARDRLAWAVAVVTETDAAYRRAYHSRMDAHLLLGLLLRDQWLPRSVGFQLPLLGVALGHVMPGQEGARARHSFDALMALLGTWEGTARTAQHARTALDHLEVIAEALDAAVAGPDAVVRSWRIEDV